VRTKTTDQAKITYASVQVNQQTTNISFKHVTAITLRTVSNFERTPQLQLLTMMTMMTQLQRLNSAGIVIVIVIAVELVREGWRRNTRRWWRVRLLRQQLRS